MRKNNSLLAYLLACVVGTGLIFSACSINVQKEKNGKDKQVDIRTPMGAIHVSKDVDAADVGLTVYPGARLKPKDEGGDDKSANVNISGFGYGLKVVALEYQSNDPPDKLISYYKDQLKKYGDVLVCHTSRHLELNETRDDFNHGSRALTCDSNSGNNTELKVGTKDNQHIVAIEPQGSGSSFALVFVRTHGKEADI
jgi:hypothetical protein